MLRPGFAVLITLSVFPTLAYTQPAEAPVEPVEPAQATPLPPALEPRSRSGYRLFGFLRLKGGVVQDDPNVAFIGRNDGFSLQNARVGIMGNWGDRLGFRVSADGAVDERVGANATEGRLRVALKDAYVDFNLVRAVSIRAVRFEPMYDLEEIVPYTERTFVDRSIESRGVTATQGFEVAGLSPGRSIGVAVRSDDAVALGPARLGYELAVTNGNGEYEAQNENNSPAYSAALFATWERSVIFVTGRQKTRTVGELPFRQTEEDLAGSAGARLLVGPLEIAGQGMVRHTTFATTGGPAENSAGAHVQAAFTFHLADDQFRLTPGYRFAIYDPSDLIATDLIQEHMAGVNFELMRVPVRLQLNYTHAIEQAQRSLSNDRVEGAFEVSI